MGIQHSKKTQEKPKTYLWTLLKWYWFIVPAFYYILVLPELALNGVDAAVDGKILFTIIYHFMNFVLSGLMFAINPIEQSKSGVANLFLKIAVAQQLVVQNIFGMILAFLTWYNLPYRIRPEQVDAEDAEKWHFKPKTILITSIAMLVISIFSVIISLS